MNKEVIYHKKHPNSHDTGLCPCHSCVAFREGEARLAEFLDLEEEYAAIRLRAHFKEEAEGDAARGKEIERVMLVRFHKMFVPVHRFPPGQVDGYWVATQ